MGFLLGLLVLLLSTASFFIILRKLMQETDDLEKVILSVVSIFTITPVLLIILNLSFGIEFNPLLSYIVFLLPVLPAAYLGYKNKILEKFQLKINWKEIVALISLVVIYLFLVQPYFAENTMWADEALDENTARNLMGIGEFKVDRTDPYVLTHRSPFNPFSLAVFYSFFGNGIDILYSFNIFYGVLSIFLIYLIGRRLFSPEAGFISSFLMVFSTLFLFYSLRYLTEIPQIFITAFATYFAVLVFLEKKYKFLPFLSVLIGIAFLIKPVLIILAPAYLLGFIVVEKKNTLKIILENIKPILFSILAILILLSPHFIYSYNETGDFMETTRFYYLGNLGEAQQMPFHWFLTQSAWIYSHIAIVILIILGILLSLKSDRGKFLSVSLIVVYFIISYTLGYKEDRYIIFVYPLIFPLAAYSFYYFFKKIKEAGKNNKTIFYIVLIILGVLAISGTVLELNKDTKTLIENKIPSYSDLQEGGRYLGQVMKENEIAISTSGWELGYYGNRKALYINMDPEEFKKQVKKYNITYIAMTAFEIPQVYSQTLQRWQKSEINAEKPENTYEYVLTSGKFNIVHNVQSSQGGTTIIIFKRNASFEDL